MTVHPIGGVIGAVGTVGGRREVEVGEAAVSVRFGWAFSALIPRDAIASAVVVQPTVMTGVGVHGFGGRWVVNGRYGKAAELRLSRKVRVKVAGVPWRATRITVGVDKPEALIADLGVGDGKTKRRGG